MKLKINTSSALTTAIVANLASTLHGVKQKISILILSMILIGLSSPCWSVNSSPLIAADTPTVGEIVADIKTSTNIGALIRNAITQHVTVMQNANEIDALSGVVGKHKIAITANTTKITTDIAALTNGAVKTNTDDIIKIKRDISTNTGNIANITASISSINSSGTTNYSDIAADVDTN